MAVFNDPARWKMRAEEARSLGSQLADLDARAALLGIAAVYEDMAIKAVGTSKLVSPRSVGIAAE
jgi:hypothetical protein